MNNNCLGYFHGEPIDDTMSREKLMEVIKWLGSEVKYYRSRYEKSFKRLSGLDMLVVEREMKHEEND